MVQALRLSTLAPLALRAPRALAQDAQSIDESAFVRIGGIDQWVALQGGNRLNPAILFLHGGPAEAPSPFLDQFGPWTRDFTVLSWDQRGAGRTYGRNGDSTPDLTLDRLVDDAIEVAEYLRARLSQRKVILVGQSWGSMLGVHVLKRRPDLFHAFVGTGQFVSVASTLPDRVRWTREQAGKAGDQETLEALDDLATVPADHLLLATASLTNKYAMYPSDLDYAKHVRDFANSGGTDAADWNAGAAFTGPQLLPTLLGLDLRAIGIEMPVPFFVIQGRDDHVTPPEPVATYVDDVKAPAKAFVLIDGGHYACFTRAGQFVAALREKVRPLVS